MPATVLKLLAAVSTDTSDSDLLARFVTERDESAFAELVRRHGPTVYRVCRRLVGPSSADDAFQATFLVLACRAKAVRKAASIGSWLIGVAGRVSRQMRRRDRSQESGDRGQTAVDHPAVSLSPDSCLLATELSAILADELTRLPDTLRDPVVLCLVEGRTQEQASAALGGSVRTLRRRLDRAKAVLQARLERRGIVPTVAAGLVAAIGSEAVAIRPRLAERAVSGVFEFLAGGPLTPAAVVAKGVVGNMARLKASAMVATVAVAMIGLGVGWANDPPSVIPPQDVPVSPPPALPDQARTPPSGRLVDDPNVVLPGLTFTYTAHARTPNFIVQAPNPVIARAVANEAEYQRAELARQWLGRELPDWKEPCEIQVTLTNDSAGGATSFEFLPETKTRPAALGTIRMELRGQFGTILESHVPHEVMHCVLATHFAKPLPRWADEGIAVAAEGAGEQINHDVRCRELLNAGRGIRLKTLFRMRDYPRDLMTLYAQGHSVIRFLLASPVKPGPEGAVEKDGKIIRTFRSVPYAESVINGQPVQFSAFFDPGKPQQVLLAFIEIGMYKNTAESWDRAAREVYGFDSVDALEESWVEWLKDPKSRLKSKPEPVTPAKPAAKSADPELIPPTKLPGVDPDR